MSHTQGGHIQRVIRGSRYRGPGRHITIPNVQLATILDSVDMTSKGRARETWLHIHSGDTGIAPAWPKELALATGGKDSEQPTADASGITVD